MRSDISNLDKVIAFQKGTEESHRQRRSQRQADVASIEKEIADERTAYRAGKQAELDRFLTARGDGVSAMSESDYVKARRLMVEACGDGR